MTPAQSSIPAVPRKAVTAVARRESMVKVTTTRAARAGSRSASCAISVGLQVSSGPLAASSTPVIGA